VCVPRVRLASGKERGRTGQGSLHDAVQGVLSVKGGSELVLNFKGLPRTCDEMTPRGRERILE
ncbi:MAG: hypothetical protein ACRDHZ_03925, partial [Ktedonobacteraceae bacterium]